MGELVYTAISSLDGYVNDEDGRFDWAAPDEEVHAWVNDGERAVGTYLCGRRMYEVMVYWDGTPGPDEPPVVQDYARIWQAADKVVYSSSLGGVPSARTRIERVFDPDAVRELTRSSDRDVSVGGPHLAAQAFTHRLVDRCRLFVVPVVVGGGTRALPAGLRLELQLVRERRSAGGVVQLDYRCRW